jgi:hypothetical protein
MPSLLFVREALWAELARLGKASVLLWEELSERCQDDCRSWMELLKVALSMPGSQPTRSQSSPEFRGNNACFQT